MTCPLESVIRPMMDCSTEQSCGRCRPCWLLPLLLGLVFILIVVFRGNEQQDLPNKPQLPANPPATASNTAEGVHLVIDFGDGPRREFASIPWRSGITVADLLRGNPDLTVLQKGTGAAAFLTTINGVENQGADGKNWLYEVNGKVGDRSFAIYELRGGDRVLWTFRPGR